MKQAAATLIAIAAFAVPAQALAAPTLGAPLPGATSAQAGTVTSTTTTTTRTTTPAKPTLNELSDRRALNSYATYLTSLIAQEPVGLTNDNSYVTTISQPGVGGCKAALTKLTQPPYQVDTRAQHTLTVLGEEMGDDLTITYDGAATEPFVKFSTALEALHWGRLSGAGPVIRHYVNTQNAVLALTASNLCADASDAQLHPEMVPDGTKAFLPVYGEASAKANFALSSLLTLLQTFEIPSEKALVARISSLASQLSTQTKADLLQTGTQLTSVLESN